MATPMPEPVFTDTLQVAIVVRDLHAALRTYVHEYGIGPWEIYEFNPENTKDMVKDDGPAAYSMRLALAMVGSTQWELIEPLDDRSIYADFLAKTGGGLHHVGVGVRDYGSALDTLRCEGALGAHGRSLQRRQVRVPLDRPGPRRDHGDLRLATRPHAGARRGLPAARVSTPPGATWSAIARRAERRHVPRTVRHRAAVAKCLTRPLRAAATPGKRRGRARPLRGQSPG